MGAVSPLQRYTSCHGSEPPLLEDGSMAPFDDPCPPGCEPLDTVMGRRMMQVICHTTGGKEMRARHLARYGNQYRNQVGAASAAELSSPETLVTNDAHPDAEQKGRGGSTMPHRSNGSGTNHPR